MLISSGIALYALFKGTATMPRMFPDFSRLSSPFELFTAVPVIVVAFTFHFNGTGFFILLQQPCMQKAELDFCFYPIRTSLEIKLMQCTRSARS
jgi:hypothetical protein